MSIRLGRDSEPLADAADARRGVGGARTAYGRSLEEATERLAKIAVASNVPLTHVARPEHRRPGPSARHSAVRDANVRSICIDFNAPTSLSVRARPTATESIFAEERVPAPRLARPASAVAAFLEERARAHCATTETKPPGPPGLPPGVWNSDPDYVQGKTIVGEMLSEEEFSITDYLDTWWYTLGEDDYRTEYEAEFDYETGTVRQKAVSTRVPLRDPVVDIQKAWNWFHDTTYLEGGNHVPLRIAYQTLPAASSPSSKAAIETTDRMGPLEQMFHADLTDYDYTERSQYEYVASTIDVPTPREDFKGIHAVMTEYLMGEWTQFLYEPDPAADVKHRFHIMFSAWAARAKKDLEKVGMFLPEYGRSRRLAPASAAEPNSAPTGAEEEDKRQTLLAGDYADFLKDFTIVIQERISSLVSWVVSYFLTAPQERSPILTAARAYSNGGFWIDYAKTKSTSHIDGPPADGRRTEPSQARFAKWATLPQQSALWDGDPYRVVVVSGGGGGPPPSDEDSIMSDAQGPDRPDVVGVVGAVGSPSPGTLHEFLFGVVLNRWLPWTLQRVAGEAVTAWPGKPVDCIGSSADDADSQELPTEEDALFCEWTRAFCAASDANKGSWSLTRDDLQFRNNTDGVDGRAALRIAVVFS